MPDPQENQKSGTEPNKPITKEGASRIQSTQAKNMAEKLEKETSLRVLTAPQTSMKTRKIKASKEENTQVLIVLIEMN